MAPIVLPRRERAEQIIKDLEDRRTSGLAAMNLLAALTAEKDAAMKSIPFMKVAKAERAKIVDGVKDAPLHE